VNSEDYENWGATTRNDFMGMFLGEHLGSGSGRAVYTLQRNPELVVKVEQYAHSFQNIAEFQVWKIVKDTPWAKWFAPVRVISANGAVLIQDRTMPLRVDRDGFEFPDELPNFFTDLKPANFGRIGRQLVCHDYAFNHLIERGLLAAKMRKIKKADWDWSLRGVGEAE
jgi:hypothetical protein